MGGENYGEMDWQLRENVYIFEVVERRSEKVEQKRKREGGGTLPTIKGMMEV